MGVGLAQRGVISGSRLPFRGEVCLLKLASIPTTGLVLAATWEVGTSPTFNHCNLQALKITTFQNKPFLDEIIVNRIFSKPNYSILQPLER